MREVVLTVPRVAVEPVLDRLLPIVPGGVSDQRRHDQDGRAQPVERRAAHAGGPRCRGAERRRLQGSSHLPARPLADRVRARSGADCVRVKVLIGILRYADRGTVRATGQAIVRHPSDA
jgi:hypothetical protein